MIVYKKIRTINGTVLRPVLVEEPLGLVDREDLPPYNWCERCGGEVHRQGAYLCTHCENRKRRKQNA